MNYQRTYSYYSNRSFGQRLLAAILLFVFISLFFYLSWQIYKALFFLSPLFVIIALVMHAPVVSNHLKTIGDKFRSSLIGGLLYLVFQIVALPIVTIGLALKALAIRKFGKLQDQMQQMHRDDQYVDFEEVPTERPLDLHEARNTSNNKEKIKQQNHYDDMFV